MTKQQVVWFRGAPLLLLAISLIVGVSIEVARRGVPDIGIAVIVTVAFVGQSVQNGVRYIREPGTADFSRDEAIARALLDVGFSIFIVLYALR